MIKETFPMIIGGEKVRSERTLLAGVENGKHMMSADSVRFLVLHCSATRCNQDYSVEQMRRDHKARGFYDIGYHFYIRKDGTCTQHRMLLEVGAHARPYNRCSIGICYEGGLDEQGKPCNTLNSLQFERIKELLVVLKRLFPKAEIVGHRDLPGDIYGTHRFGASVSYDHGNTWKDCTNRIRTPENMSHGTAIAVPRQIVDKLKSFYEK